MKAYPLLLASLVALCACNRPQPDSASAPATAPAAQAPAKSQDKAPAKPVSPERAAQIMASGKAGLWQEGDGVCDGRRQSVHLMWNLVPPPTTEVELYRLKPDGTSRRLLRGTAVGERTIGRWVTAGMIFVLRPKDGTQELGRLVIAGKHC